MAVAEQWVQRPQTVWLRKALFQIHLWTGVGLGLYIFVISISGSAIVFRNALYKSLGPKPTLVAVSGPKLTKEQLKSAAEKAHPKYRVSYVWPGKRPNEATEIWLQRDGKYQQRLFDPFTGKDLGPSVPLGLRVVAWFGELHFNLLAGKPGRAVNGYLAIPFTVLCLTGVVVWWPGIKNWRRSLTLRRGIGWKRFNWDLHSFIGFWTLTFSIMWGLTGVYVVYPAPFQRVVALFLTPDLMNPRRSPDEQFLRWFTRLHFGNFGPWDWPLKVIWVIIGLAPAVLFVTGLLMWWNRVVRPRIRHSQRNTELVSAVLVGQK